ncbi:hypothetical protein KSP39_PZI000328 [Platanthera zijinensis]|uniref:Uncharacterized protein n=1 Tax=Platanthera zijinensis TaxID=2320716 RepID=A0AAP0BZV9_9ASPA
MHALLHHTSLSQHPFFSLARPSTSGKEHRRPHQLGTREDGTRIPEKLSPPCVWRGPKNKVACYQAIEETGSPAGGSRNQRRSCVGLTTVIDALRPSRLRPSRKFLQVTGIGREMILRSKLAEELRDYQIRSQRKYWVALSFFSAKPQISTRSINIICKSCFFPLVVSESPQEVHYVIKGARRTKACRGPGS